MSYIVIYEGDRATSNVVAYIPALNMDIIGDTYEEAREITQEILNHEISSLIDAGSLIPDDNASTETLLMGGTKFPVLYESNRDKNHYTAYIPGFRIRVQSPSLEDVKRKARIVLQNEVTYRKNNNTATPEEFVCIERVSTAQVVISTSVPLRTLQIS
ncbi:hypothetical protein PUW24_00695 (plasmid) [Paenibacillus urinalis]|uniref:HicB-like antitoxin of toxin-antitoxin system domain-containing protein n=1 Tax=Paenibacillus urinalis TaxID=521520 RepID=A0AAX3N929_9BACL|nr:MULTISPECIES: hypothetical protein [Paenibacillus]MCM3130566.1 hypothetical protein [Paenibacillus sp. MER 78]WDH85252.1 hypothetical protein PUW23_25795 [Paenibacillus urinalis]WDH95108.1 hypothetical protein PUW24_00695 [Paenibacillus urinalis]WDI05419.1 hypothetical protein PUW25_26870 [Paenibacillus urinalis]